ncbi:protein Wnt-9a [Daphnia magna]|uniref:protein Wnt-9a n=1 Tax=Daphnia magna TaxID=35525 RepID=UPI001E1BADCF|nr:protein Wnt-9a [Daphnia magna]
MPMGRSLSTIGYCAFFPCPKDFCQCSNRKRMLASLLLTLLFSRHSVFAVSSSSSFGISAPAPLSVEALSLPEDVAGSARPSQRNVSEWQSPPNVANNANGVIAKQPNNQQQSADLCDQLHLTPRQKQMCVQGGDGLAGTLLEAIRMSVYTCQQQFEYERWNCTLNGFSRILTLKKAYKETAALYAFSAAGVAHAVARACAAGRLRKCHCAEADNEVETRQTWRWGGCGDNLAYGRSFAMKFLDSGSTAKVRPSGGGKSDSRPHTNPDSKLNKKNKSKSKDGLQAEMEAVSRVLRRWRRTITSNTALAHSSRMRKASSSMSAETGGGGNFVANGPHPINKSKAGGKKQKNESQRQRINRHNNAVGMKVVEQLVKRTCKCHGVSGSCSVKTCWNQLAVFSETAAVIKSKYDNAVQVNVEIRENSSHLKMESSTSSKNQESNRILPQSRAKKGTDQVDEAIAAAALARNGGSGSVNAADRVDRKEMIYQQKSPDFCVANPLGPGTVDRQCLRGENCDILCCGRGYNVHRLTVSAPCKCKLVLCCQVECQTCLVEKTIHTCK